MIFYVRKPNVLQLIVQDITKIVTDYLRNYARN